ncbi:unnamed protein product [Adineta ricciae]|uniref:Kynureninase n=1 Tax=Adineta ricciae TaxID=249248 RepID=A0A814XFJ7_ADIRI|nr:unnamed protein product [Adineta ricciae]
MPSIDDTVILSTTALSLSAKMSNQHCNGDHQSITPQGILEQQAEKWQVPLTSKAFAHKLDEIDPLKHMRDEFVIPTVGDLPNADTTRFDSNSESIYLCGHSLGLLPKRVRTAINGWLEDWAKLGVHGHVHGRNPFAKCDYPCIPTLKKLLGAQDNEVMVMNQLTSNIHIMMISFYRPTKERFKILYEERAFPSDEYALHSQMHLHGYDPNIASIKVSPRKNETYVRTEDILDVLEKQGQSIALLFLSGVQYYTGQLFDMETITRAGQKQGCVVGWDLAHALGNVPLHLHDWNVDFGVFCSYKYLNGGAGGIGGIFIHSNQFDKDYPRLDGWWGNRYDTRFQMRSEIDRDIGADGFRMSNPSIHQCTTLAASLEVFKESGIEKIRAKSKLLTQYMQYLIETEINQPSSKYQIKFLTPSDPEQRGAQLSLHIVGADAKQIFNELERCGVSLDVRGNVIRVAAVPLYNSFLDVYQFVMLLKNVRI